MGDLSKHFSASEFKCKCGKCPDRQIPISLILALELLHTSLSHQYGQRVVISVESGHRCEVYNATIPEASPRSKHIQAIAADIKCYVVSQDDKARIQIPVEHCADILKKLFPESLGIGLYETFLHIDTRQRQARWDFR